MLFVIDCCIIIIFYPRQSLFSEHTRIQHVTIALGVLRMLPVLQRLGYAYGFYFIIFLTDTAMLDVQQLLTVVTAMLHDQKPNLKVKLHVFDVLWICCTTI